MEIDSPSHPAPTPVPLSDATAAPPPPSPSPVSTSPRDDVPGGHPARARRSKRARPTTADDGAAPAGSPRRKRRGTREPRAEGAAASAVASPVKRSKRGARGVGTEEKGKEAVEEDAAGKVRRRKATGKAPASRGSLVSLKEKGSSLTIVPYPTTELTHGANNERQNGCEGLWEMVTDLVMWNNVAKSAFCPISVSCRFGVVMLGLAFFKDSVFQRQQGEPRQFQLTDEDFSLVMHQ
ncbi:hypothetical protein QOZ80_6BG0485030 [Eleusine coracana subsp. coracana]|nr:hypothetical protein QOZ80_6BG0485030 [Eleusine coracana subsp. coracana]